MWNVISDIPQKIKSFGYVLLLRKFTPACRNACLRIAASAKAGTPACRHVTVGP